MIGATSHFWMSREYVAVRSSLTRAVYFRSNGCLKNLESRKFAKIPNAVILSLPGIGSASHDLYCLALCLRVAQSQQRL